MFLKANKPGIPKNAGKAEQPLVQKAVYLWRMIAFQINPKHEHQRPPIMDINDLPKDKKKGTLYQQELAIELDNLAGRVVSLFLQEKNM